MTETPVRYENNKLKSIDTSEKRINALRVVENGKLGFATSTSSDLDQLLDMALTTAKYGRPWDAPLPGATELPPVELEHPSTNVSIDTMVDLGTKAMNRLKTCHSEALATVQLSTRKTVVRLINSQGFSGEFNKSVFSMLGAAELTEGQNMLSLYSAFVSGKLEDQVEKTVEFIVDNFQHGLTNATIPSGDYTVIFSPPCLGDILRPLLACANGQAVAKGFSPWKDKLGDQLFSPHFSLYDDATIPYGPASSPFDGEGIATKQTKIIDQGVLKSFLLDLRTAQDLDLQPTGNGFRSRLDELPRPGSSNVVLDVAGGVPLQELIDSTQRGIIIHSLMGAWAGNPYTGQVNGNIDLGFLIEDGQIKGRVKDCMVSVDCFQALRDQIIGASAEKQWAWNNMLLPHLKLSNIAVNAKG